MTEEVQPKVEAETQQTEQAVETQQPAKNKATPAQQPQKKKKKKKRLNEPQKMLQKIHDKDLNDVFSKLNIDEKQATPPAQQDERKLKLNKPAAQQLIFRSLGIKPPATTDKTNDTA